MDINKHIVKNDDDKPFHSSGYANVANGGHIGSVGNMTFEKRQQIEQNRRIIQSYRYSSLGRADRSLKEINSASSNANDKSNELRASINMRYSQSKKQPNGSISRSQINPPRRFSEPPKRFYNPFG